MKSQRKLFSKFSLAASALAGLMVVALVAPAGAGVVQFSGKLRLVLVTRGTLRIRHWAPARAITVCRFAL